MIKNNKGFTLLETLIAVVILASGIMLLTSSWSGSFARIRKTQLNQDVAALLERKMAEIDLEFRGKALETIPSTPMPALSPLNTVTKPFGALPRRYLAGSLK